MIPALLAAALCTTGFLAPTPVVIRMDEDSDDQAIVDACHLPGGEVELETHSNMLRGGTVDALRRCRAPRLLLRMPLAQAHIERLEKVPRAEPVIQLAAAEALSWQELSRLGPRRTHVRVGGGLTAAQAEALRRVRNADVELDVRGRVPKLEELTALASLDRADHWIRVGADTPGEVFQGLLSVRPSMIVVETKDNRLPPDLLARLNQATVPVRIALIWPVVAADLQALAAIPQLSLEVEMGMVPSLPGKLRSLLEIVGPASEPHPAPDGGFTDPLQGFVPASGR